MNLDKNLKEHFPSHWTSTFENYEPQMVTLTKTSIEYEEINKRLKNSRIHCVCKTNPKHYFKNRLCNCGESINITSIERVENPYLWLNYILKKNECKIKYKKDEVITKTMYHSTSSSAVANIIKENLDWRRVSRGMFGRGVSFSPVANYGLLKAQSSSLLLECEVLTNNVLETGRYPSFPENEWDTTRDGLGLVYVKYSDFEFYPHYIIHVS